ncbi:MAG: hypothetical protein QT02_C0006G0010 [archaeon GW2011_AR9]|nr:MAG: hypothetical protein QT02_C0006G0010 [archaeon GW2011_AR9]HIH12284.1 transglycosylase SLT domain-containing protein [Candidatus Woesearchaeota archaeon]
MVITRRSLLKILTAGVAGAVVLDALPSPLVKGLEHLVGLDFGLAEAKGKQEKNPYLLIEDAYKDTLGQKATANLEDQIQHFVGYLRSHGLIPSREQTSFYVYDLEKRYIVADINIDQQRMSASLIKPFVMAAAYDKFQRTKVKQKTVIKVKADLRAMIQHSNNVATNRVIDFVGGTRAVQAYLNRTRLFSETKVVEKIPSGGRTYSNKTSAHDLNILLNQLYQHKLVSPDASREMLATLDGYHTSRIDDSVIAMEGVKDVAGKTGFVAGLNGETTIIEYQNKAGQKRPFIFTALFEDGTHPHGNWGKIRSEMIRKVAQLTVLHYQSGMVDQYRAKKKKHTRIEDWINEFAGPRHAYVENSKQRAHAYINCMQQAALTHNVPYEVLYSLLLVESGFQARVQSPTGPKGIAQFTAVTAQEVGLSIVGNDERLDPQKAIDAAALLLRNHWNYFQGKFTDNHFIARDNAIAAYQAGRTAIKGWLDSEKEVSYWHLDKNSAENKDYVPKVLAARKVVFGIL